MIFIVKYLVFDLSIKNFIIQFLKFEISYKDWIVRNIKMSLSKITIKSPVVVKVEINERIFSEPDDVITHQLVREAHIGQYKLFLRQKQLKGEFPITFHNTMACGHKILDLFYNDLNTLMISIAAEMQSGKTSIISSVIEVVTNSVENIMLANNIFVLTSISSVGWMKQTSERLPPFMSGNIYHRPQLKKLIDHIVSNDLKNIIIFIDEVQCASGNNQTFHRQFDRGGLNDVDFLRSHNILIVNVSATYGRVGIDAEKWSEKYHKTIFCEPGFNYKGVEWFKNNKIYHQLPDMKFNEEFLKLVTKGIRKKKGYVIIRISRGGENETIVRKFSEEHDHDVITYYQEDCISINDVLGNKPDKLTYILIKEKLGISDTIIKKYILRCVERVKKSRNTSESAQTTPGRLCGYDKLNKHLKIYCDLDAIHDYSEIYKQKILCPGKPKNKRSRVNPQHITYGNKNLEEKLKEFSDEINNEIDQIVDGEELSEIDKLTISKVKTWLKSFKNNKNSKSIELCKLLNLNYIQNKNIYTKKELIDLISEAGYENAEQQFYHFKSSKLDSNTGHCKIFCNNDDKYLINNILIDLINQFK
jgi:hypothetical protein